MNEQELDVAIKAAQELGAAMSQEIRKAWNKTLERQVKKLTRRERYLCRYRQRGF